MPLISLHVRAPMLLAQIDNWRRLGERFSGEHLEWRVGDVVGLVTVAVTLFAGFWLLRRLGKWQDAVQSRTPRELFREVADAHRLGFFQRRTCRELARSSGLKEPAELFVRPDLRESIDARDPSLAVRIFGRAERAAADA